jgi:hypothetical protein
MTASESQRIGDVHLRPRAILAVGLCVLSVIGARADTPSQIALAHVAVVDVRDAFHSSRSVSFDRGPGLEQPRNSLLSQFSTSPA